MPLSGTLDTVPLTELLQWFQQTGKSGTLTISVDLEDTTLLLEDGAVVAVGSDDPLRLEPGHVLLVRGRISEEQLQWAHQAAARAGGVLAALVQGGLVEQAELDRLQDEHLFELILDLLFREQGSFLFTLRGAGADLLAEADEAGLQRLERPLGTELLLLESMRRLDEWERIRKVFPNRFAVVRALEAGGPSPNRVHAELWTLGQPISIGELVLRLGGGRFAVYQGLFEAYQQGLVVLDETPAGRASPVQPGAARLLLDSARVLMAEHQYDEAREVLATAANLDPADAEVRSLQRELRQAQLGHLYQIVPPHRTPVLARARAELDGLGLSARERYLASRLTGKLDVATLVVATPLGELETLRILRKLLHAGIARLQD